MLIVVLSKFVVVVFPKEDVSINIFWPSISTQKARGAVLERWFRKEVGYTLSFTLEWRTRFCARGGRHGALTFIERDAFSGELPILLCSNLSSICIQRPFRDNFISVPCLLSAIYFPGVAVCCNILPWKEFLPSASTGTFLSKPLMHFWTKVGSAAKTWRFLLVRNVFWCSERRWGMMGVGMKADFAQRKSVTRLKAQYSKRRGAVETAVIMPRL